MQCCSCKGVMEFTEGGIMVKCPYCDTDNYSEPPSDPAMPVSMFKCGVCSTTGIYPVDGKPSLNQQWSIWSAFAEP